MFCLEDNMKTAWITRNGNSIIKHFIDVQEFKWEKYALEALQETGVAPKLLRFDEGEMYIEMEIITLNNVNVHEIIKGGDNKILDFARAEYNLKKILDENGVAYYDWKCTHLFYDEENNFLRLIDYSGDQSNKEKNRDKSEIDLKFAFTLNPNYIKDPSYIEYKEKLPTRFGK